MFEFESNFDARHRRKDIPTTSYPYLHINIWILDMKSDIASPNNQSECED